MLDTNFHPRNQPQKQVERAPSEQNYGKILNVKVTITQISHLLAFVRDCIVRRKKFLIVTPNSEIILQAQNDPELMKILNSADLALLDSYGVFLALKFLGVSLPANPIIKGRKAFIELITLANKKSWKVYLLGGRMGISKDAAKKLSYIFKKVKLEASDGPMLDKNGQPESQLDMDSQKDVIQKINSFAPQLLFVGFGAPKQEKWVAANFKHLNVGGVMVVGGTFDFVSGRAQIPPIWMEGLGLEWLWRGIREPWRFKRVINAVVLFPWKVFLSRLK